MAWSYLCNIWTTWVGIISWVDVDYTTNACRRIVMKPKVIMLLGWNTRLIESYVPF